MRRSTIYILLLLCLAFNVYANVYGGEFAYDDYYSVRDNPGVHTLSNFGTFFTDISRTSSQELRFDIYRPLTLISYALTYVAFGPNPIPYHVINNLIHAINVILVFLLLRRAFGDDTKAALAAAIFAVHPAQSETVCWISAGRANGQSLLFMLLAFLVFLRWMEGNPSLTTRMTAGIKRKTIWLYVVSLILYIFSMLSKESGIVLPALILAWISFVPVERGETRFRRHMLMLLPFFAAAAVFFLLRTHVIGQIGQMSLHGRSLFTHTLFAVRTTAGYLPIVLAPIVLTIRHHIPPYHTLFGPLTGVALSAIILAIYFPLRLRKRSFLYPLGMAWFFIALSPVMNIVPIRTFVDERMLYVPVIGFAIIIVQGAYDIGVLFPWRRAAIALLLCLIALYSVRTVVRNRDWVGPIQLWESAARVDPTDSIAMYSLGYEHEKRGHYDLAVRYYLEAMRSHERAGLDAMTRMASIMERRGQIEKAMFLIEEATKLYPSRSQGYIIQAWVLMEYKKDFTKAESLLNTALELDPDFYYVHHALNHLYENTSRPEKANIHRERASELNPDFGITGDR